MVSDCCAMVFSSDTKSSFFWAYIVIRHCLKIQKISSISLSPIEASLVVLEGLGAHGLWSFYAGMLGSSDYHRFWHIVGVKDKPQSHEGWQGANPLSFSRTPK